MSVKQVGLEATVADLTSATSGLLSIAATSVNNMRIAMGGSSIDMSSMTATAVLAEHDSFSKQFTQKFKVGGVAAVDSAQTEKAGSAQPDALQAARLRATRYK
jgi:hypothetical protein